MFPDGSKEKGIETTFLELVKRFHKDDFKFQSETKTLLNLDIFGEKYVSLRCLRSVSIYIGNA